MAEEVFGLERCFPSRFPVLPHPCLPLRGRCRAQRWRKRYSASNDVFHHVSLSCHTPASPPGEGAERSDGGRGVRPRTMFSSTFPCPAIPLPSPQGKVPSAAMAEEVFGLERCFPSRFPVLSHPCLPLRGRCRAQRWRKRCSTSNDVFHHVSLSRHTADITEEAEQQTQKMPAPHV